MHKLTYLILFITSINFTYAQVNWGVQAGLGVTTLSEANNKGIPSDINQWQLGAQIGIYSKIPLGKKIALSPNINFVQKGTTIESRGSDLNYRMYYFNLPLLLSYNIWHKLSLFAGPELSTLIADGDEKASRVYPDRETLDYGFQSGISYQVNDRLSLNAFYTHSLVDNQEVIFVEDGSSPGEKVSYARNRGIFITTSFYLHKR